jgi:hypothetical protein
MSAAVAASLLTACGSSNDTSSRDRTQQAPVNPATERDANSERGIAIRIRVGEAELSGRLEDNATARDLAAELPLTLRFRDHNTVEKTAPLPRRLNTDGAAAGHDPAGGDIGYWAPDGDLVLYYDSTAPYWDGIVRIGRLEADVAALRRQRGEFSATVERAE